MSPEGTIKPWGKLTDEEKKLYQPIPEEMLKEVQGMNRQLRRKWYRDQKKSKASAL